MKLSTETTKVSYYEIYITTVRRIFIYKQCFLDTTAIPQIVQQNSLSIQNCHFLHLMLIIILITSDFELKECNNIYFDISF